MTRRSDKPQRPSRFQKNPAKAKPAEAAEELPTLEPMEVEELPTLESIEEAPAEPTFPVKLLCSASEETGYDVAITLEVPDMEKKGMADAVAAPLEHAFSSGKAAVRHRRVVVSFTGDAIIGSAVKERCGQLFDAQRARKVVLRRGYGDEVLFEREAPKAIVATKREGKALAVSVETGELEAQDLGVALQAELVQIAAQSQGARVQFTFRGANKPDASLRTLVEQMLRDSGALAASFGQRVLFDREMEDRVRIEVRGEAVTVRVAPSSIDAETEEALAMRLSSLGDQVRGKVTRIDFATAPSEGVRSAAVRYCTQGAPQRIEVAVGEAVEIVWPSLLTVGDKGGETTMTLTPNGRSRAAMLAAFAKEARDFQPAVAGKSVAVHWPEGTALDAELEALCVAPLVALSAARVAFCVGAQRDPLWPLPVALTDEGGVKSLRVDTEAGKPAELQRAFDRWQKANANALRGASARLSFAGSVAPSRTLLRTLSEAIVAQKCTRLEIDSGGAVDVVWPRLLLVAGSAGSGLSISADPAGRDAAQSQVAIERELAAVEGLSGAKVSVADGPLCDLVVAAVKKAGAATVAVGGVQVHPAMLEAVRSKSGLRLIASPVADVAMAQRMLARELPIALGADGVGGIDVTVVWASADAASEPCATLVRELVARGAAVVLLDNGSGRATQIHPPVVREFVRLLGTKDDATPPLSMFGVILDDAADQPQQVAAALAAHSGLLAGRRVLLVGLHGGAEVPFLGSSPIVKAAREVVDANAAATLCFRGKDALGRGCFGVAKSVIEGLAFGQNFADPRGA